MAHHTLPQKEEIFKVLRDGYVWLVDDKQRCIANARRLKEDFPDEDIKVIKKSISVTIVNF